MFVVVVLTMTLIKSVVISSQFIIDRCRTVPETSIIIIFVINHHNANNNRPHHRRSIQNDKGDLFLINIGALPKHLELSLFNSEEKN
jgi:hypothetical protein